MTSRPQATGPASLPLKRARAVLEAALKRKPSERVAFIDGACATDDRLRDEVLDLLDAAEYSATTAAHPQLPPDRAGAIVSAALERRRNERLAFAEGACEGDDALRVRVLALLASVDTSPQPPVRIFKSVAEVVAPVVPAPIEEAIRSAPVEVAPEEEATRIAPPAKETAVEEEATRIAPPVQETADEEEATRIAPATAKPVEPTAKPSTAAPTWHPGQPMEGRRIGPYQLLHSLGKGGMGSVYAASRADQEYKKLVAIKLVTSGLGTEEMLRRFRNERQVLAGLDHPNIARLLDGGSTDDGLPYLVMEYVEGLPIDKYCESHHLSLTERLGLFQKVCAAVQYAHQNLVVHRDIKPGNIVVGVNGDTKLLDFGIARLMTAEFSAEEVELNRGQAQPMTLRYASPEQVRGEPITTESDIYSLGVLLYELVAGQHPFQAALTGRAAIESAILNQEPERPSVAVAHRAEKVKDKKEQRELTKLSKDLTEEVDPMVLQSLAKQARSRYPSAESFSQDIARYLTGFPVHARKDEMGYRARKFVRRHVLGVAAAAMAFIVLIAATVISLQFAHTAQIERLKALSRFENLHKLADFMLFQFDDSIRHGETAARKVLVPEALKYLDGLAKDSSGDKSLEHDLIKGYLKVGDLQGNPNYPSLNDLAGAKKSYLQALSIAELRKGKSPNDPVALQGIAAVDMKLGDLAAFGGDQAEAIKRFRRAQELFKSLASDDLQAKFDWAKVTERMGTAQLQVGDVNAALESYRQGLRITQELHTADPGNETYVRTLGLAYDKLGQTLASTGAVSEGLERLAMAQSLFKQAVAANPKGPSRTDLAILNMEIGYTLANAKRNPEAVVNYRSALTTLEALANEDPTNIEHRRNQHITLARMADALYASGNQPEARDATKRALQVLGPMVDDEGASDYETYAYCWLLLTTPFKDLQAPTVARHFAEKLVQNNQEKDPNTLDLLARALDASGEPARAVATESKALALLPANTSSDLKTELTENLAKFRARAEGKQAK